MVAYAVIVIRNVSVLPEIFYELEVRAGQIGLFLNQEEEKTK